MRNIKILVEYDGTDFHGWQRQKTDITVQGVLENALSEMTQETIVLHGSGRTDAGVHALGQVASFTTSSAIPCEGFLKGINRMTPSSVVVKECKDAEPSFHARFDAREKTYLYRILNQALPLAIGRQYSWHIPHPLDLPAMEKGAQYLVGEMDFRAFEGVSRPGGNTVRTVFAAGWQKKEDSILEFHIRANGFLRYMVRNIVGALAAVGSRKMDVQSLPCLIRSTDRTLLPPTAPPHGLFLACVRY